MELFDVYTLFDLEPVRGEGSYVYTEDGQQYLDFYGGHAVISIGHSHPHYVSSIKNQAEKLVFYSNSVKNSLQHKLVDALSAVSGISDYGLFLCNSGAEANENALKLASFHNKRKKVLSLKSGFHGRTSAAVNATDGRKITAPINEGFEVKHFPIDNISAMVKELRKKDTCAVIVEAVQGIGGIYSVPDKCLKKLSQVCNETNTILIADEVQCGYARTGDFFAFQQSGIQPDVISMAKGMGNGFPIGGVLINHIKTPAWKGMLGSTFGGNHLACAAGIAVLETIEKENLKTNAKTLGEYLIQALKNIPQIKEVRGRGLMIGIEFDFPVADLRKKLLFEHHVFTGSSSNQKAIRLLPPLNITKAEADEFLSKLKAGITNG
jgi:acetylornithine aminotransferase